jgi:hypothetical protein
MATFFSETGARVTADASRPASAAAARMRAILLAAVRAGNSRQGIARAAGTGYNWTTWTSLMR